MEHLEEMWEPVPGFPFYEVSNYGEVMNLYLGRTINGSTNSEGYRRVGLRDNKGILHTKQVSRLVAEAFLPDWDPTKPVKHRNHILSDNCVLNLYMGKWQTGEANRRKQLEGPGTTQGGKRVWAPKFSNMPGHKHCIKGEINSCMGYETETEVKLNV